MVLYIPSRSLFGPVQQGIQSAPHILTNYHLMTGEKEEREKLVGHEVENCPHGHSNACTGGERLLQQALLALSPYLPVTALGVLCCFALLFVSTLLVSSFLPSHLSLHYYIIYTFTCATLLFFRMKVYTSSTNRTTLHKQKTCDGYRKKNRISDSFF